MNKVEYLAGSDLPDLGVYWYDSSGALIDFTGWSFELKVGQPGETALLTKTGNIVGGAGGVNPLLPNVVIAWTTTGELNSLAPGSYRAQLRAQRPADNKQRYLPFTLEVGASVL